MTEFTVMVDFPKSVIEFDKGLDVDLIITTEFRFIRTPDSKIWTETSFPYEFWLRYLSAYRNVTVIARIRDVNHALPKWQQANGPGVRFICLPHYIGPTQYLVKALAVHKGLRFIVDTQGAIIMRVASHIAASLRQYIRKNKHPYGLEVVGDPGDVFAPGSIRHALRPFFRWWFVRQLRIQCAEACAVAYVTKRALQSRYPAAAEALKADYSDVELTKSAFVAAPRDLSQGIRKFNIVLVGSLAQLYKGTDLMIDALSLCHQRGLNLKLSILGDGKHRHELEARAKAHGLADRVQFLGDIPSGETVRKQLDLADLFVLPSRTDSMPRAMLEAMARGLPCIGSSVGGIPELLPPEDLVPPGDAAALAAKIFEVMNDPGRMSEMSARNLEKAREYREEILRPRRNAFYGYVRDRTREWLARRERS